MGHATEYKHIYMLPGIDGTGMLFDRLARAFGYRCRTTVLPYEDEETVDDYLDSISERLPKHRALIFAESFSGPLVLALLARYPGRFRGAILATTFARSPFMSFFGMTTVLSRGLFGAITLKDLLLNRFCAPDDVPEDVKSDISLLSDEISPEVIKQRLHIMDELDVRHLLPSISTPVLYLHGLRDKLISEKLREELFESVPRIAFKGIDGPHLLVETQPVECADTIINFLDMIDAR